MKYFDFHAHILLKQLFDENINVDSRISPKDVGGIVRTCTDLPNIIETQIHQSQLANFQDEVIVGVALYGLESKLAHEIIPLRKFFKADAQHKLSLVLLQDVSNTTNPFPTFTDFTISRTLDNYLNATQSFNILSRQSFTVNLPKNKVNIFFVIEGCHSLVDSSGLIFPPNEILNNLDILLQKARVMSINPTHLQQSNLCNHAFGIQLTDSKPFYPIKNGLTDDGRTVIQGIFDRKIHVDLKHMSYKSRFDLRNEINAGKFNNVQPILCSHAGFTGISFDEWTGYITRKKGISDVFYLEVAKTMQTKNNPQRPGAPAFNMTTINLFNEEIAWIVNSGGIIGLSMDRRIIGYVDKFDDHPTGISSISSLFVDKEYFSQTEWATLGLNGKPLGNLVQEGDCVTIDDVEESTDTIPARDEYFYDHILLHLKHYFQVCQDAGIPIKNAQKQITIGSDFDGLINPFITISTVEDIPELKKYILMNFKFYLQTLSDSRVWESQLDINEFIEALFYNNGFNFIKNFFTR